MKTILGNSIAIFAFCAACYSADLTSVGSWVETITAANLVAGAGSNIQSQIESIPGVSSLTVSNSPGTWTVRARLSGSQSYESVSVYVKRCSSGSGGGSISGGTAYVQLSGSDTEIFSGSEPRSSITLQFKLTGLTRNIPPATYLSSIIFTVQ